MIFEFPYAEIRGEFYPVIPLILNGKLGTSALIDSGATVSIFKPDIAYQLNIDIESGKRLLMEGVSGRISVYIHQLSVKVEEHEFACKIGFSEEYTASLNILGRDNFFNHFLVTFDENKRKIVLEKV